MLRTKWECKIRANTNIERANTTIIKGEHVGSPLHCVLLNDVDETIRELSVRAEAWALGCVRDSSGYETLNQLRITN